MSRVTIYDRFGILIAEMDVLIKRSWVKNNYGTATFSLSTIDSKCRREIIEFSNHILIQHDKLPDWGGVIMTPRSWGNGAVNITAYSAMWKYKRIRSNGGTRIFQTPASFIVRLIERINAYGDARIRAGSSLDGTGMYSLAMSDSGTMYDTLKTMVDAFPYYWIDFIPGFDDSNRLIFNATWSKYNTDVVATTLEEGNNIEALDPILTEQGDIINDLRTASAGISLEDKQENALLDQASIDYYGKGSRTENLTTNSKYGGSGTPYEETLARLNWYKQPRKLYNFKVLDIGNAWRDVRIGTLMPLRLYNVGFQGSGFGASGSVRVIGMVFSEDGRLETVCEEST